LRRLARVRLPVARLIVRDGRLKDDIEYLALLVTEEGFERVRRITEEMIHGADRLREVEPLECLRRCTDDRAVSRFVFRWADTNGEWVNSEMEGAERDPRGLSGDTGREACPPRDECRRARVEALILIPHDVIAVDRHFVREEFKERADRVVRGQLLRIDNRGP